MSVTPAGVSARSANSSTRLQDADGANRVADALAIVEPYRPPPRRSRADPRSSGARRAPPRRDRTRPWDRGRGEIRRTPRSCRSARSAGSVVTSMACSRNRVALFVGAQGRGPLGRAAQGDPGLGRPGLPSRPDPRPGAARRGSARRARPPARPIRGSRSTAPRPDAEPCGPSWPACCRQPRG